MEMSKRIKGKHFSDREICLLLDIVESHIGVIENKRTDAITSKGKTTAWEEITRNFNSSNSGPHRTIQQLKVFYDNFKRKSWKEQADDKANLYLTGRGTFRKTLGENGERLQSMLKKHFECDANNFDCESCYHKNIESDPLYIVVEADNDAIIELSESTSISKNNPNCVNSEYIFANIKESELLQSSSLETQNNVPSTSVSNNKSGAYENINNITKLPVNRKRQYLQNRTSASDVCKFK